MIVVALASINTWLTRGLFFAVWVIKQISNAWLSVVHSGSPSDTNPRSINRIILALKSLD